MTEMPGKTAQASLAGEEKRCIVRRLVIYLLLVFGLTWTPMFLFIGLGGEYNIEEAETALLLMVSMLWPTVAVLLTRKITGEGIALTGENSLLLGISFRNRKWIWYAAAFAFPIVYWLIGDLLWFGLVPESFNPGVAAEAGFGGAALLLVPLRGVLSVIAVSFGALGEEIGWRTYLYPRLEQLFGLRGAVLSGGIIWGIWHFPLIAVGHSFGSGYFGEPYTGFLIFTADTVATGCLAYLVTKRSGSVWPATFLHAFSNTGADMLLLCMDERQIAGVFADSAVKLGIRTLGCCIVGFIGYRMLRGNTNTKRCKRAM